MGPTSKPGDSRTSPILWTTIRRATRSAANASTPFTSSGEGSRVATLDTTSRRAGGTRDENPTAPSVTRTVLPSSVSKSLASRVAPVRNASV